MSGKLLVGLSLLSNDQHQYAPCYMHGDLYFSIYYPRVLSHRDIITHPRSNIFIVL